ncbi:MAG TPA: peptidoglycan recognition family protein [Tepidisphaeraceae bacterium]|nr:peptidoglycan recognition family protein [Tepidisphaeraceae bacterium]
MARYFVVFMLFLALAGCQPNNEMVQELPPPNFSGPTMDPLMAVNPAPARPVLPTPNPQLRKGIGGDAAWAISVPPRPWKWIVIHHSATAFGAAARFDRDHRAKGWDELGYHFVIGNGTESGNGQVEVGSRWPKQKYGAHAKTPDEQFNNYGIGICLVGNFDIERPTPQQMQSLARLTAYMMRTYNIPASHVIGHRDTKQTDCPGHNLDVAVVRQMATRMLADAGETLPDGAQTASVELQPFEMQPGGPD